MKMPWLKRFRRPAPAPDPAMLLLAARLVRLEEVVGMLATIARDTPRLFRKHFDMIDTLGERSARTTAAIGLLAREIAGEVEIPQAIMDALGKQPAQDPKLTAQARAEIAELERWFESFNRGDQKAPGEQA